MNKASSYTSEVADNSAFSIILSARTLVLKEALLLIHIKGTRN